MYLFFLKKSLTCSSICSKQSKTDSQIYWFRKESKNCTFLPFLNQLKGPVYWWMNSHMISLTPTFVFPIQLPFTETKTPWGLTRTINQCKISLPRLSVQIHPWLLVYNNKHHGLGGLSLSASATITPQVFYTKLYWSCRDGAA